MKTFKIFLFIIPDMVKIKKTGNFWIKQMRILDVIMMENFSLGRYFWSKMNLAVQLSLWKFMNDIHQT